MSIKLVFIITSLSTGGAETMLLKVLERLDRKRFSPHVISLTTFGQIGPRIQALGIPVEALAMKPGRIHPLALMELVRRLKALGPETVHTWMYHADFLGGVAAKVAGVPAVSWAIRHFNLDADKNKLTTRAVVYACALLSRWIPDRIFCCSQAALQVHASIGYRRDKMVVVPNGFDLSEFKPDPQARKLLCEELGLSEKTRLVGVIARFHPQKNHAGFFGAARQLHRRLPEVHFVLVGKDVDSSNEALTHNIQAAGVGSVTHLLGLRHDISDLIPALDVLVSPSHGEAFSNVVGEAMACGVLCAVTDVGDSSYIVADTGRVVPAGDMVALAVAVEELLALPARERMFLSERARARMTEYFEIGKIVRLFEQHYAQMTKIARESVDREAR